MNAIATGQLVDDHTQFFAPMASDLIDNLIAQYNETRERLDLLAGAVRDPKLAGVLHYFINGNCSEQKYSLPTTVDTLFRMEPAVAQLNAKFWSEALSLTDVIDYMPQKRRDEWFEQIRHPEGAKKHRSEEWTIVPLPEFIEDTVRATLASLLANRSAFFAERVDGIFRELSREHVTNCPQGFNKRMIISYVITSYGTIESSRSGYINDLRCVVAKFMGREEPKYGVTDEVIKAARRHNGKWMLLDGGSLRIRVYNGVGTAHLEIHPDMAWRLNGVLASLYPMAIPAEFRTRPKKAKKIKDFELFDRPLPFHICQTIAEMRVAKMRLPEDQRRDHRDEGYREMPNTRCFYGRETDKATSREVGAVLEAIGGVPESIGNYNYWRFDYEPSDVIDEIVCSGCIPDHKSHQFYATPAIIAKEAIKRAKVDADPGMIWLEPSAGQGALADLMPREHLTCIEISPLHCKILEAKGYLAIESDFLKSDPSCRADRIVMNPPFSEGRWLAHVKHAASLLSEGGKLVAILPGSARGQTLIKGFEHTYSTVYSNEFAGTAVSVVIVTIERGVA